MEDINLVTKDSNTSIASDIHKLEIDSQSSIKETSESENESIKKIKEQIQELSSSSESSTDESSADEEQPANKNDEQPQKRKRRRKRKRKLKSIAAYMPDEPFTKRYKKAFVDISMKPKLHVKFDDIGNVISYQNNYKPRIIMALPKNLSITDNLKEKVEEASIVSTEITIETTNKPVMSLKPRIIKAIGT